MYAIRDLVETRQLVKYSAFLKKFNDRHLFHHGTTVQRYFYLSEFQIKNFKANINKFFDDNRHQNFAEACYSYAFSFYALIRVALEASKRLTDEIQKKDKTRKLEEYYVSNENKICYIKEIANDFVKHPLENLKRNKLCFYEPGGLDSLGNLTLYKWSVEDESISKTLEINPIVHCDQVFEFLEGLASIYLEILNSESVK